MPENLNAIGHHPDPPTWDIARKVRFTSGAPTEPAYEGAPAIDEDSGDIYIYESGAWVLKSSGGGGGGGAGLTYYQGAGLDPNGVQSGSVGDVYHSKVSLGGDGSTWWKVSGTGTTTVWE